MPHARWTLIGGRPAVYVVLAANEPLRLERDRPLPLRASALTAGTATLKSWADDLDRTDSNKGVTWPGSETAIPPI